MRGRHHQTHVRRHPNTGCERPATFAQSRRRTRRAPSFPPRSAPYRIRPAPPPARPRQQLDAPIAALGVVIDVKHNDSSKPSASSQICTFNAKQEERPRKHRLPMTSKSRVQLPSALLRRSVFGDATFETLRAQQPRHPPLLVLNSADMATGERFPFVQRQLDRLCLDLREIALADAVAASAAFPIALIPLRLPDRSPLPRSGVRPGCTPHRRLPQREWGRPAQTGGGLSGRPSRPGHRSCGIPCAGRGNASAQPRRVPATAATWRSRQGPVRAFAGWRYCRQPRPRGTARNIDGPGRRCARCHRHRAGRYPRGRGNRRQCAIAAGGRRSAGAPRRRAWFRWRAPSSRRRSTAGAAGCLPNWRAFPLCSRELPR